MSEGITSIDLGSRGFGTSCVLASRVFVPTNEGLVAVDAIDDELSIAWIEPGQTGSPIIAAEHVLTLGRQGLLKVLDPADGTVVHTLQIAASATQFAKLSAANGRVFVADGTRILALTLR